MKSISFNQAKAKGFSLIELLLVLGVLAILLVAAFVVYPQVRDRNQANAEVSNLTAIKANITNLYASRGGNYDGLTTDVANQARAFPSSMNGGSYTAGTTINAAWGGEVTVEEGTNNRLFEIEYTAVPDGVCLGLVSGAASNFQQVEIGGTGVFTSGSTETPASAGGQFDPAAAAAACAAANNQTIKFISN